MSSLAAAYERCRRLHRRHGRSYYLATKLLPAWKRRHVHALYGFTRYADEIVDGGGEPADRAARLADWSRRFLAGLHGQASDDPLLPAVLDTIAAFDLDRRDFAVFLESMAMDLTVTGYRRYDDLLRYMEGSAAVVGTMMLPILGTVGGAAERAAAREPARQLGLAFQLTNMIRDVAEDLARGRVYLPVEDLERFGVCRADLAAAAAAGVASARIRELIAYEASRAREHYALAVPGIELIEPSSRGCVRAAYRIYGAILDEVVRAGYDVFVRRAVVPRRRRLTLAAAALVSARLPGDRTEGRLPGDPSEGRPTGDRADSTRTGRDQGEHW